MMQYHGRAAARLIAATVALSLVACDLPTSIPRWDTNWASPVEALELRPELLLPPQITITDSRDAFEIVTTGTTTSLSLGELCFICQGLGGLEVPKPAFTGILEGGINLPADFIEAPVVGGHMRIDLLHDFGFDPIRPSATLRGSLHIALISGGDTLAATIVDGEDEVFPSGVQKSIYLPYREVLLRDSIAIEVTLSSPEGDEVLINESAIFRATIPESLILISEAEVRLVDLDIDLEATEIEMVGGEAIINRIRSGTLLFEVENPFSVRASFQITLRGPDNSVHRQLTIEPGHTKREIELTGAELRSVLSEDEPTMIAVGGEATAIGGSITIRPDQVLVAKRRLDLVIANLED